MGELITIEGGEYTGKTSIVVPALRRVFEEAGFNARSSREPGGTPRGEEIRREIFEKKDQNLPAIELAKLFYRARQIHLDDVVFPFLGRERQEPGVMLLDRYLDSSLVYQGLEGGVPIEQLIQLNKEYAYDFYPDLTIILYFSEEDFDKVFTLRRVYADKKIDRQVNAWDKGEVAEHLQRQRHYLSLPGIYKDLGIDRTFALVDASQHPREVIKDCLRVCAQVFDEDYTANDLIGFFDQLDFRGEWDNLDVIWKEQHESKN